MGLVFIEQFLFCVTAVEEEAANDVLLPTRKRVEYIRHDLAIIIVASIEHVTDFVDQDSSLSRRVRTYTDGKEAPCRCALVCHEPFGDQFANQLALLCKQPLFAVRSDQVGDVVVQYHYAVNTCLHIADALLREILLDREDPAEFLGLCCEFGESEHGRDHLPCRGKPEDDPRNRADHQGQNTD